MKFQFAILSIFFSIIGYSKANAYPICKNLLILKNEESLSKTARISSEPNRFITPFQQELSFGFEPQATTKVLHKRGEISWERLSKLQQKIAEYLISHVPGGRILSIDKNTDDYRIQGILIGSDQGKYKIGHDLGFVEVQPMPVSLSEIKEKIGPVFRAFEFAGLTTKLRSSSKAFMGTGLHIHVEKTVFEKHPILLRNLLADLHNRPYLESIFNNMGNHTNAIPFYEAKLQDELFRVLAIIDSQAKVDGYYVYQKILDVLSESKFSQDRYLVVNLMNLFNQRLPTVEFRLMGGQVDENDLSDQAFFLAHYLEHLSKISDPIAPKTYVSFSDFERQRSPLNAETEFLRLLSLIHLPKDSYQRFIDRRFPLTTRLSGKYENEPFSIEVRVYDNRTGFNVKSQDEIGGCVEFRTTDKRIGRIDLVTRAEPTREIPFLQFPNNQETLQGNQLFYPYGEKRNILFEGSVEVYDKNNQKIKFSTNFNLKFQPLVLSEEP